MHITQRIEYIKGLIKGPPFPKRIICVEIGNMTIKAVEIDSEGTIHCLARTTTPKKEALRDTLAELLAVNSFGNYPVYLVVSGAELFIKQMKVPAVEDLEIATTIRFNALKDIPIPRESVSVDYYLMNSSGGLSDVLVGATSKEFIQENLRNIQDIAGGVFGILPGFMGLVDFGCKTKGLYALLDIGYKTTTMLILKDGNLLFHREIHLGIDGMVELLAKKLYNEDIIEDFTTKATTLIRSIGLEKINRIESDKIRVKDRVIQLDSKEEQFLIEARDSGIARLIQNIRLTLGYFKTQNKVDGVELMGLCGAGAMIPGLLEKVAEDFHIKCDFLRPFEEYKISEEHSQQNEAKIERDGLAYAKVIGCARHLFEKQYEGFNLMLPREERRVGLSYKVKKAPLLLLGPLAAVLLVFFVIAHIFSNIYLSSTAKELKELNSKMNKIKAVLKEYGEVKEKNDRADLEIAYLTGLDGGGKWSEIMYELNKNTPGDIGIDIFRFGNSLEGKDFEILGTSLATGRVTEYGKTLQDSKFFEEVNIISANQEAEQVRFEIRGKIRNE